MRKTAFAGLFACACVFAYSPSVNAEALDLFNKDNQHQSMVTDTVLELVKPLDAGSVAQEQPVAKKVEPKAKKHKIVEGESLDSIARLYKTSWKRLYDKNKSIDNPDMIKVGQVITIPNKTEKVKARSMPQPDPSVDEAPNGSHLGTDNDQRPDGASARRFVARTRNIRVSGSYSGNTYTPGQCTWHVKNLMGDNLPNGLGNADEWYYRAQARGLATGTQPRVGAAGVRKTGNHAVYVTAVHGNGTITVSEMNYNWTPFATRTAVKSASDFYYIY